MTAHLKRSRIVKALTDREINGLSYAGSEDLLSQTKVAITVGPRHAATPAGQAAMLTAIATAVKCFGAATFVGDPTTPLTKPLRCGATLGTAAVFLGASIRTDIPAETTHVLGIAADGTIHDKLFVRCWWDDWLAGVLPAWDERTLGRSGNPLTGVSAGALAVREIFAAVVGNRRAGKRASLVSLWEPWQSPKDAEIGPAEVYLPTKLWFVGLGHLGQGYLWSLGLLPVTGALVILQDDQDAGTENEATGLLTYGWDIGTRKTRVAASWLEPGWSTSLIERRHHGDIRLVPDDPALVFAGLDNVHSRFDIARAGFDYMIDAGVGHGPVDFESFQLRVLHKGVDPLTQWVAEEKAKDIEALLRQEAYRDYVEKFDACGAYELAEGSVAVPFVGAMVGALGVAQAIRIASGRETAQIVQADLGAPSMAMSGRLNNRPIEGMGRTKFRVG